MLVDKERMSSYVLCENLSFNKAKKKKEKRTRGTGVREYEILRPFFIFLVSSKILSVSGGWEKHEENLGCGSNDVIE